MPNIFGDTGASQGLATVVRRVNVRLSDEAEAYDDALIAEYAATAADVINGFRDYVPTADYPVEPSYMSLLVEMTMAALTKRGAEGQTGHTENGATGVARTYDNASDYPDALLGRITPKVCSPKPVETEPDPEEDVFVVSWPGF